MNGVYAAHVGDRPPARSTVEVAKLPSGALVEIEAIALSVDHECADAARTRGLRRLARPRRVPRRRRGPRRAARARLEGRGLPRPRRRHRGAEGALAPHGRVEDLDRRRTASSARACIRATRRSAGSRPAGIEFAPPRKEVSTGPGRHDFEIVADAALSVEDDMRRRDFTVNAMARRLSTGELVDPLDGREDLERRVLRTVSPSSFAEDPLRLVRALRFVSQLGFEPRRVDAAADARRGERRSGSSRASASAAASPPTGWASSRSCCSDGSRRARCGSRATRACSSSSCRSSSARSASTRRAATTRSRSTSTRSRSCRRRPTPSTRSRSGSRRSSTISASRTSRGAAPTAGCTTTRSPGYSRQEPRAGRRASSRTSALSRLRYPNALRSRVLPHRPPSHVPDRQRRRAARAALPREVRRRARVRARRPQGGRLPRQARRDGEPPVEDIEKLDRFRAAAAAGADAARTASPISPSTATT